MVACISHEIESGRERKMGKKRKQDDVRVLYHLVSRATQVHICAVSSFHASGT